MRKKASGLPVKQGLYDPQFEHDSCGVGFVADIKGRQSNQIVKQGLEVLKRLAHRGAVGADPKTGDGAGILIQTPHDFFSKVFKNLPALGQYGSGLIFFPTDETERQFCQEVISKQVEALGLKLLGWRKVPLDNSDIGKEARDSEPIIEQIFVGHGQGEMSQLDFEKKLYTLRVKAEKEIRNKELKQKSFFYITNISSRTFTYKGLLMTDQVEKFFVDLKDPDLKSAIALVHSRYSTNTFPTWDLAQPFRFIAHNGEINTLRGNINWMKARGYDVIVPNGSDSATIDNVFEFLSLSGRSLPHVMMMLIPGAWEHNQLMGKKLKDFYKYHACFMEPWDGPAAIAFTDGTDIGAVLDRNGLRPARYLVTKDDLVVMASEVGVLDIAPENVVHSGRLEPGKIFFIDTKKGKIVNDEEIKQEMANAQPYGQWLEENLLEFDRVAAKLALPKHETDQGLQLQEILQLQRAFGYSREDLKMLIKPMAENGKEPVGSMGNDVPHAVLSKNPQPLYTYFKQLFAQVTNPAIDPIREEVVMSFQSFVGPQQDILTETAKHCQRLLVKEPILFDSELERLYQLEDKGFKTKKIDILFDSDKPESLVEALNQVCRQAVEAVAAGFSSLVLSDRGMTKEKVAIPALLACGAVHHHLVNNASRTKVALVIESGEPREVHHFALLFGYGADCVNPYLAFASVKKLLADKLLDLDQKTALKNYRKAVNKGILKVLSKMGISTLQSYRGAQIFEALGISDEVIDRCFVGTPSRIGGATFKTLAQETIKRHQTAFDNSNILATGGLYQWKKDGEFHLWNPESIAAIQEATRKNDYGCYKDFARLINDQSKNPTTLRSLLKFKETKAISLEEVEPIEEIFKRFATGAMSFGSISRGAHETLAIVMNRLGGRSNTGEGGEDPARFNPLPNGDSKRSAIKQVASGRFGVSTNYLVNSDEIQIKIAQGAKPGEGGQLPGHKVSVTIAKTRYTTPGVTLISPPPHHDIYSIEDLAQLIFDLKNANPEARISVKLVSEMGVGTVAAGVAKGHADMILISGADGGTGASPLSSMKHAGLPWELGLSETHQTLVLNDLRSRVRLQTDGQMRTGRDVAIAAMLGAEEYGFCTSALIVMGCVMLRHCHLNNCSVGVATQDELCQKRFQGKVDDVVNYFHFVATELREIMAQLGVRTMTELIGRSDLLETDQSLIPWKAEKLDLSKILYKPKVAKEIGVYCQKQQDHGLQDNLDWQLIEQAQPALEKSQKVKIELSINNAQRTVGTTLSGRVCKKYGETGLSDGTIHCKFTGCAGQSFGAWLAKGITFELEGLANDYIGKGISGGKIIVYPGKKSAYQPENNILIGNTTFYGAITGEAYIRGLAGERFCIRNSGLYTVVEGLGDHGCEYMTGGRVVVLGETGRNFGAGMSGGIAYIYDPNKTFKDKCNLEMVELQEVAADDLETINYLLHNHHQYTGSPKAKGILDNLSNEKKNFVKVMPLEYKRILTAKEQEEKLGLEESSDG